MERIERAFRGFFSRMFKLYVCFFGVMFVVALVYAPTRLNGSSDFEVAGTAFVFLVIGFIGRWLFTGRVRMTWR